MKTWIALAVFVLFAAQGADAEIEARSDSSGNVTVFAGVDLLGLRGYRPSAWADSVPTIAKVITYPLDWAGYMLGEHPLQALAIGLTISESAGWTDLTPVSGWLGSDDDDSSDHSASDRHDPRVDIATGDNSPVNVTVALERTDDIEQR